MYSKVLSWSSHKPLIISKDILGLKYHCSLMLTSLIGDHLHFLDVLLFLTPAYNK